MKWIMVLLIRVKTREEGVKVERIRISLVLDILNLRCPGTSA